MTAKGKQIKITTMTINENKMMGTTIMMNKLKHDFDEDD